MTRTLTFAALALVAGCSDYQLVAQLDEPTVPEDMDDEMTVDGDSESCQHDRSAYIEAEVISLGQDAWIPGWNTIAEFTLATDKDTCFDETVAFGFTSTDEADTDWNDCEEYVGQDRLHIFRVTGADSNGDVLEELDANWTFQGATSDWGTYVHDCEDGRYITQARPLFVNEDTTLLATNPLTFVVMMEAGGSIEPTDKMRVKFYWDDSSRVNTNSGNAHGREGNLLPFEDPNG